MMSNKRKPILRIILGINLLQWDLLPKKLYHTKSELTYTTVYSINYHFLCFRLRFVYRQDGKKYYD